MSSQNNWDRKSRTWCRWAIILVSAYIGAQVIADVSAPKIVQLFGLFIPGGSLVFALTFTIRDLLHKKLGKSAAQLAIWVAAVVNIVMALTFQLMIALPAAPFCAISVEYATVLGSVWHIVAASIIAELISELVDTELFHWAWKGFAKNHPWLQVVFSNLVSAPLDSIIFGALAFVVFPAFTGGDPFTLVHLFEIVLGQSVFKWAIGIIIMPTIYLIREA